MKSMLRRAICGATAALCLSAAPASAEESCWRNQVCTQFGYFCTGTPCSQGLPLCCKGDCVQPT